MTHESLSDVALPDREERRGWTSSRACRQTLKKLGEPALEAESESTAAKMPSWRTRHIAPDRVLKVLIVQGMPNDGFTRGSRCFQPPPHGLLIWHGTEM